MGWNSNDSLVTSTAVWSYMCMAVWSRVWRLQGAEHEFEVVVDCVHV